MRRALSIILLTTWALWFGGMIALLIFVTQLFRGPRAIAVEAAPVLFRTFALYQLITGGIACAWGTLLALSSRRSVHAILTLFMLAALGAALLIRSWTFQMEAIRAAGESAGPQFKALHVKSSVAYTSAAALLLVAGIGWIITMPSVSPTRTSEETARA
ncbi:MAG TPA: hypothetical protein VH518_10980 [Tepidisphaeraceae bacterium]|jgi:hypothetical protein